MGKRKDRGCAQKQNNSANHGSRQPYDHQGSTKNDNSKDNWQASGENSSSSSTMTNPSAQSNDGGYNGAGTGARIKYNNDAPYQGYEQQCDQTRGEGLKDHQHQQPMYHQTQQQQSYPPKQFRNTNSMTSGDLEQRGGKGSSGKVVWETNGAQEAHTNYHQDQEHRKRSAAFTCRSCQELYNKTNKTPRSLYCGHNLCTSCIENNRSPQHKVPCAECPKVTFHVISVNKCPVNRSLLQLLEGFYASTDNPNGKGSSSSNQISVKDNSFNDLNPRAEEWHPRPVVTVGGKDDLSKQGRGSLSLPKPPAKSPHNSRCLEMSKLPTLYCVGCKQWVCKECAEIDHSRRGCALTPLKDALQDKKQENKNTADAMSDSLGSSVKELENYDTQLEMYSLLMRGAFESIEKKRKLLKAAVQEGSGQKGKLATEVLKIPDKKNLPEALAQFQTVEDVANKAQHWMSSVAENIGNTDRIERAMKDALSITLECLQSLQQENGASSQIFVSQDLPTGKLLSELKSDQGRIHINCLTPRQNIPAGARVLPLQCALSCLSNRSILTFLDLAWGGRRQGRVYVRLTGNTQRGHQFVKLCTGEMGPSFRNTHFHRVWWKGLPGEHVWAGDYENGDGSGQKSLIQDEGHSGNIEPSRRLPITAGMVAGRYEKEKFSSVFRIYTKGAKDAMEEAAFGQVEFGMNTIEDAIKESNILNVAIHDCGIVLEV